MNTDQEWDDGFSGLARKIKITLAADVDSMPMVVAGKYATDLVFNSGKAWITLYTADGSGGYKEDQSLSGNGVLYSCVMSCVIKKETTDKTEEFDAYLRKPVIVSYQNKEGYYKIIGTINEPVYLNNYSILQGAATENHYSLSFTAILAVRPRIVA